MIGGRYFFHPTWKNDTGTYDITRKVLTDQGHDYTTGCLPDYSYFKEYYKLIATDLSKQQNLDANLNRNINAQMLFIIEEAKETIFPKGNIFKYNINIKWLNITL